MKIKICSCKQCRYAKKGKRGNHKKRVKRMINRLRRRGNDDKAVNWYWA